MDHIMDPSSRIINKWTIFLQHKWIWWTENKDIQCYISSYDTFRKSFRNYCMLYMSDRGINLASDGLYSTILISYLVYLVSGKNKLIKGKITLRYCGFFLQQWLEPSMSSKITFFKLTTPSNNSHLAIVKQLLKVVLRRFSPMSVLYRSLVFWSHPSFSIWFYHPISAVSKYTWWFSGSIFLCWTRFSTVKHFTLNNILAHNFYW